MTTTNNIGDASEALVIGYLRSRGFDVSLPFGGHARADLIYFRDEKAIKVQVKTSCFTEGKGTDYHYEQTRLGTRLHGSIYSEEEVDEFWIVGTHLWCFPYNIVTRLKTLSLFSTNPSPRKTIRTYNPDNFIVVKGSRLLPFRDRLWRDDPQPAAQVINTQHSAETLRAMRYK